MKKMTPVDVPPPFEFEFSAGRLCLDFANTVADRPRCTSEHLSNYSDLLRWGLQAGLLSEADAELLERMSISESEEAGVVFAEAVRIRETLYAVFSALAQGREVPSSSVKRLNNVLGPALFHIRIRKGACSFDWVWQGLGTDLSSVVWPVIRSASELLTCEDVKLVRECASESCSWLFLDRSRTRRRRWCDMKTCGNRAKARRHYRKKKRQRLASQ